MAVKRDIWKEIAQGRHSKTITEVFQYVASMNYRMKKILKWNKQEIDGFWNEFYAIFMSSENKLSYKELGEKLEHDRLNRGSEKMSELPGERTE